MKGVILLAKFIKKKLTKEEITKMVREYILILFGTFIVAAGMFFFFNPAHLSVGGANGLAVVLNHYLEIGVGNWMYIINIGLFILAFLTIGSQFGVKTIIASLLTSGFFDLLEKLMPNFQPLTGDTFVELFFGVFVTALGMAIVFNQGASTGGTDIIAKILNKFIGIDLGKGVLISDVVITLLAGNAFGARIGIYSLFGVIVNGFLIDFVIEGMNMNKEVKIIAEDTKPIEEFIIKELDRGATIYKAYGMYTKEQRDIIMVLLDRKDFLKLKNFLRDLEQKTFISVSNASEVLGYGFKNLKD